MITQGTFDEMLTALRFGAAQIERLAEHAFSDSNTKEWLEKCDAFQCMKRAIARAEKEAA